MNRTLTSAEYREANRSKAARPKLREAEITRTCCDFLRTKQFRCVRLQSGLMRGFHGKSVVRIGEKGMTDYVMLRSRPISLFFCEFKAPSEELGPDQVNWIYEARAAGFLVAVVSSFDEMHAFYHDYIGEGPIR